MSDQIPVGVQETYGPRSGSTPTSDYTPTSDDFLIDIDVDFVTRPITPTIHLVQYDYVLPVLAFHLYSNRNGRPLPSGCVASIRINNGNGTVYYRNADGVSDDRMTVYFKITSDLCISPGFKPGVIELSNAQGLINSSPFSVEVEQNPVPNDVVEEDESYISLLTLLDQTEKWREDGSPHLTNNSYIVTGKASATDVANYATAEGSDNSSLAIRGHAEGYNNTIASTATSSHAEGSGNTVSGVSSHVEGDANTASGAKSHSEGYHTTASSATAHSEGNTTTASGESSHSEGNGTTASGDYSHAEGYSCEATGDNSHSEGYSTKSEGASSHAEGTGSTASGASSHAEGNGTTARGSAAHAEGGGNTASGDYSHAEGGGNTASGNYSHAGGSNSTASGAKSFVHGDHVTATTENEVVFGAYNAEKNAIFEVGYGMDSSHKFSPFYIGTDALTHMVCRDAVGVPGDFEINSQQLSQMLFNMTFVAPMFPVLDTGGYTGTTQIELHPTADIPKDTYGTFTAYTDLTFAAFENFVTGMTLKVVNNVPVYYPDFRVVRIWNVESGNERDVSVITQNYAISNVTNSGFRLTVTFNVHNNSASNVPANDVVMKVDIIHYFKLAIKQS